MMDFPDKDDLRDILRDKAQHLLYRCPDVVYAHLTRWLLWDMHVSLRTGMNDEIILIINGASVWDYPRNIVIALEEWDKIERVFIRKQRRFDRRILKLYKKIQNIKLREKT